MRAIFWVQRVTCRGAVLIEGARGPRDSHKLCRAASMLIGQRLLIRSQWDMGLGYFSLHVCPPAPFYPFPSHHHIHTHPLSPQKSPGSVLGPLTSGVFRRGIVFKSPGTFILAVGRGGA